MNIIISSSSSKLWESSDSPDQHTDRHGLANRLLVSTNAPLSDRPSTDDLKPSCLASPTKSPSRRYMRWLLLLLLLSLPSAYADDEVSTSLLHLLRSLARTVAVVKSSLHSSKSLTLSIHFFLCRPLLLFPWMFNMLWLGCHIYITELVICRFGILLACSHDGEAHLDIVLAASVPVCVCVSVCTKPEQKLM